MDKELLYIWLNNVNGIGAVLGKRLIDYFGSVEEIYNAQRIDLLKVEGIGEKLVDNIINSKELDKYKRILEKCKALNIKIITLDDKAYPLRLKRYEKAPLVLYLRGELKEYDTAVSIVGSRRCDDYGKRVTVELAEALSSYNIPIISGMAKGIDSYAHTVALNNKNYTIAVLGTGVDICYPKEHIDLMEKIIESGAVISQFEIGSKNIKENFIKRNEIIAMLSDKVIVVQAAQKSGALYTARYAMKNNIDTYAVPGKVYDKLNVGTNSLINEGANIYLSIDSILSKINKLKEKTQTISKISLGKHEEEILKVLIGQGKNTEHIKRKLTYIKDIDEKLLELEIQGFIKQVGGLWKLAYSK